MGLPQPVTPELYCDNLSACYLTANPTQHNRTKHFDNDFHYVRERVALGALIVKKIPTSAQIADVFTKSLPQKPYFDLRYKLGVELPPASRLRGCIKDTKPISHNEALVSQAHVKPEPRPSFDLSVLSLSSVLSNGKKIETTAGRCTVKVQSQIQLHNRFGALGSRALTCH